MIWIIFYIIGSILAILLTANLIRVGDPESEDIDSSYGHLILIYPLAIIGSWIFIGLLFFFLYDRQNRRKSH